MTASFTRENVRVNSKTPGVRLDAWLYKPSADGQGRRRPMIVMAHGFGARKAFGLQPFAEAFASTGRLAIIFDYRTWGASEGLPRDTLDINMQREDYKTVIEWAKRRDDVDPTKVVAWGSSFSGGHSSKVASEVDVAAAMGQCPLLDGLPSVFMLSWISSLKLLPFIIYDSLARYVLPSLLPPLYVPTTARPGHLGYITTPDGVPGYAALQEASKKEEEDNAKAAHLSQLSGHNFLDFSKPGQPRIRASTAIEILKTRPVLSAHKIKCPYLLVIGEDDSMISSKACLRAVKNAEKGESHLYTGGHFAPYPSFPEHEKLLKVQLDFLDRVL